MQVRFLLGAHLWARGSVGRAPPWHGGGQGFESPRVHFIKFRNMEKPLKVAIIGAGTIGLYIADKLSEQGHYVSIFEKKSDTSKKICSGLISERIWKFIDYNPDFIKDEFNYCFVNFGSKTCKLIFSPKHYLIERDLINERLVSKLKEKGVKIFFNNFIQELPSGFDKIIACDGATSIIRTILKSEKPDIFLGGRIFLDNKKGLKDINTWSKEDGFFWAIPHRDKIEYGVMGHPNELGNDFYQFLKDQGLEFEKRDIEYAIIPQGLVVSNNNKVVFCGDSAGMTKPWSGGGVIWGLTAADILIKNFPDFEKYNREIKNFFEIKILKGKIIKKATYYIGNYFSFLIPKEWTRDNDFPLF